MGTLPTADHELSDSEILECFGPLFAEFHQVLSMDPHVLADIAERMAAARRLRIEKAERSRKRASAKADTST